MIYTKCTLMKQGIIYIWWHKKNCLVRSKIRLKLERFQDYNVCLHWIYLLCIYIYILFLNHFGNIIFFLFKINTWTFLFQTAFIKNGGWPSRKFLFFPFKVGDQRVQWFLIFSSQSRRVDLYASIYRNHFDESHYLLVNYFLFVLELRWAKLYLLYSVLFKSGKS